MAEYYRTKEDRGKGLSLHCPEYNLNLCIKPEPVTAGADAMVNIWFWFRYIWSMSRSIRGDLVYFWESVRNPTVPRVPV